MFHPRYLRLAAFTLVFVSLPSMSALAESKDMIQLQTQVQQLQDAVARLQQSNDERMGVLKDLVQQTADSMNKMSVAITGLQLGMQNQQEASKASNDQLSGQVQSLNDSLDELKARVARMEKALSGIEGQQQSTNALLQNLPQAAGASSMPPAAASAAPSPSSNAASLPTPAPKAGPSAGDLYRRAYADYMSAKYPVAASEFADLIKAYPDDNLSGNAYFYIGEIDVRTQKPTAAVKNYDQVLERYPDNTKIAAAHLHKASALISMKQNEKGVAELRALIQRFPNSPEASQARAKLSTLHSVPTRE